MKNQIKYVFVFILTLLTLVNFATVAWATSTGSNETAVISEGTTAAMERGTTFFGEEADKTIKQKILEMFPNSNSSTDAGLPVVTIDDASNWMERKGFEVIGFLQKFIQPFAIIVFIFSGIMVLLGSFGNSKSVSQGLWGMFIALIMYVTVLYAPEIMDVFLGWVQS